jgi:hypothetical protein
MRGSRLPHKHIPIKELKKPTDPTAHALMAFKSPTHVKTTHGFELRHAINHPRKKRHKMDNCKRNVEYIYIYI